MIRKIGPSECLDEKKTQSSGVAFDGPRREFAVAKQVNLVLANMFWAEAIWRTVEVLREITSRLINGYPNLIPAVSLLTQ